MVIPMLPENAPFSPEQRAWLNGFLAGLANLDQATTHGANGANDTASHSVAYNGVAATVNGNGAGAAAIAPTVAEEEADFSWHDPNLEMGERLQLAEGKPIRLKMMAAMAQLDCGQCGYLCQSYAAAIADGEEKSLSKCVPGGKETAKKLKELVAG